MYLPPFGSSKTPTLAFAVGQSSRKVVKSAYHANALEEQNDMKNALEYFCLFLLIAFAAFGICYGIMNTAEPKQTALCCYCHSAVSESADVVILTDGRRAHAECYLDEMRGGE